jgi:hypothetical protein
VRLRGEVVTGELDVPLFAGSRPISDFSRVDLPTPLRPRIAVTLPASAVKLRSRRMWLPP